MSIELRVPSATRDRSRQRPAPHVDLSQYGHERVSHGLRGWQKRHLRRALAIDAFVGVIATAGAFFARHWFFGSSSTWFGTDALIRVILVVLPFVWIASLLRTGAYASRFIGAGTEEYRAVTRAGLLITAIVAFLSYAFKLEVSRGFMVVAVPILVLGTVLGRWILRQGIARARRRGEKLQTTVVVGRADTVAEMVRQIRRDPETIGLRVVGACVSDLDSPALNDPVMEGITLVGTPYETITAVDALEADVVAVSSHPDLAGHALRRLGWMLEQRGVDLLVSPGIVEVAGPRLSLRRAEGLPMLHVERPITRGATYYMKSVVDRVLGLAILLGIAPILAVIALLIKLDDRGPVFFRQERVGDGGQPFTMIKFRSMCVDAEARLAELVGSHDGNATLFKLKRDPRITRVGAVLRKYSLDELPQIFNVVFGQMSLVGPRPPLKSEVDTYEDDAMRRLRVRPGMTGLWQVSGRSDLSWEDSLRLDLWYVDNWSLALDVQILVRTVKAVARGTGAY